MEISEEHLSQLSDGDLQAEWDKFHAYSVERQRLREAVQRILRRKSPQHRVKGQEIPEGGLATTRLGQKEILLARVEGEIYAMDNACSHYGYPLSEGKLDGHVVTCRWHDARFDVRSGKVVAPGRELMPVRCFRVRVSTDGSLEFEEKQ